ncbi:hypothetical protein ANCCAN_23056 [Ancylostoma caninum]|uniref:PSI domain-containing protein n=1 Tax=Ancylostoma caninum TaxID=29170 RepID=A0A368FK33_ANCCA|nr:hypothetical protein ANCCAN_23056 [Ancylostoma caninum]
MNSNKSPKLTPKTSPTITMLMSPAAPLGTLLLWAALIAVGNAQSLSELVGLGEFTETQRKYCQFAPGESPTCENCVAKGTECFYCGGTTERCLPYAWYFPGCELNDVKHNKCWG